MAALKSLMVITIPIIFLSIFHNVASSERQQRFLDHHRQHMGDDEDASNDQPTELPRRQPARFYCPAKCECEIAEIATSVSANQSPVVALEPRKRYRNNYYTTYYASGAPDDESSPETRQKKMGVRGASVSVYCRRGNLTDVDFSEILQQITAPTVSDQQHLVVTTLEIIGVPHRPNAFRWNDNLNRLTRLRKLVLVNCAIPALSQALRMPALKHLDLSRNRIDAIQMGSFIGLPLLETLDLSHNQILTLPTGAFMYSKRLARLALSHNK